MLQTGQEITELDQSGFATQSATVFAGNVGSYIIQATRTDIRLLKGSMKHIVIILPHFLFKLNFNYNVYYTHVVRS